MAINNNAVHELLNTATSQVTGATPIDNLDFQGVIDIGTTWDFTQKDQWTRALVGALYKNLYTDTSYSDVYNDVFYEDKEKYGAVCQVISIEMPDVIASSNWTQVTSGTTTIGTHTVYLPIVNAQLYGSTDSWAVPVSYTGTQLNAAFTSAEQLQQFYNYLDVVVRNSITEHRQVMASINRNNFIGEKLASKVAGKINKINLVEEYAKYTGASSLTVNAFLQNSSALRYSVHVLKRFMAFLTNNMTTLFTNTETKGKFVPADRFVFQILSDYESILMTETYSSTYHDDFIQLPYHRTVPAWQALTTSSSSLDFTTVSSIDVTTASGEVVSESGIVALMCDKWAIMHTIVQNRVGVMRDDIDDITLNEYQFTDRYINNLSLPAIVFVVQDYSTE